MSVSFNGIKATVATFKVSGAVEAGDIVKVSAAHTVAVAADGDTIAGVVQKVEGSYASVLLHGYAKVKYKAGLNLGYGGVAAYDGKSIKTSAAGHPCVVLSINATTMIAEVIL